MSDIDQIESWCDSKGWDTDREDKAMGPSVACQVSDDVEIVFDELDFSDIDEVDGGVEIVGRVSIDDQNADIWVSTGAVEGINFEGPPEYQNQKIGLGDITQADPFLRAGNGHEKSEQQIQQEQKEWQRERNRQESYYRRTR